MDQRSASTSWRHAVNLIPGGPTRRPEAALLTSTVLAWVAAQGRPVTAAETHAALPPELARLVRPGQLYHRMCRWASGGKLRWLAGGTFAVVAKPTNLPPCP